MFNVSRSRKSWTTYSGFESVTIRESWDHNDVLPSKYFYALILSTLLSFQAPFTSDKLFYLANYVYDKQSMKEIMNIYCNWVSVRTLKLKPCVCIILMTSQICITLLDTQKAKLLLIYNSFFMVNALFISWNKFLSFNESY